MTNAPLPALLDAIKQAAVDELQRRMQSQGYGDIRPAHGCVFRFVEPTGSRLTYLADRARLTKQAVGEFVNDLEQLGYVARVPDPTDGRAKIVRLTEKGREAKLQAEATFFDIERIWAERIGQERMADLRATLEDLYLVLTESAEQAAA